MMIDKETGEVMVPFMRTAYNYDMNEAGDESAIYCADATRTQQQFKEEVDINTIVRNFGITGELPTSLVVPEPADFDAVHDFQTAMNVIRKAEESFMEMPADVRAEFSNDPQRFLEFVHNPKNLERARELGIANPAPPAIVPPEPLLVRLAGEESPQAKPPVSGGKPVST